ncbi:MAG TPA: type II toxin-antitoxin system HicB family antitoxin [Candidatus Thermoplasmatota archaeon]|nr:type II toxin-antitoxin system HicB family antitoxin [Candidatus Thermoplasmatota archaeon]
MAKYRLSVLVEKDADGYTATCVDLQGCYAQGDTYEEAIANVEDAIRLHVEDRVTRGEHVPVASMVSLTTIEISV